MMVRLFNRARQFASLLVATVLVFVAITLVPPVGAQDVTTADEVTAGQTADITPPVISLLPDLYVEAADATGEMVLFGLPITTDDIDGSLIPVCAPASGSIFALGTTSVICSATDNAGNRTEVVAFHIAVRDSTPPVISQPADVVVTASDQAGAFVSFETPGAIDSVSGAVGVACGPGSGTLFPVGSSTVTCTAQDVAGNGASVSFSVTVNAPVVIEPTPTQTPVPPTVAPTIEPSPTVEPTATAQPTVQPTPVITPTPAALGLPWPPPAPANPIYGSGPIDGLSVIWGGLEFPVSQEYGHTLFSLSQPTMYLYGADLGLDGRAHPGLDIGMGRGTYLYSPINGTVVAAGGTGGFSFYGNTLPGVGELRIQSPEGHQMILGHMAAIAVNVGDQVTIGQFVGLSGGYNGDHLHLEVRQSSGGGFIAVDPRLSFLVPTLTAYNNPHSEATPEPEVVEEPDAVEKGPETAREETTTSEAGISDGNESMVHDQAPASDAVPQIEAGISDGNEAIIPAPAVEAARRDDEPEESTTPDASLFLQALVSPPEAPVDETKRSAIEAIMSRNSQ